MYRQPCLLILVSVLCCLAPCCSNKEPDPEPSHRAAPTADQADPALPSDQVDTGAKKRLADVLRWMNDHLMRYRVSRLYEIESADMVIKYPPQNAMVIYSLDLPTSHTNYRYQGRHKRAYLYDMGLAAVLWALVGEYEKARGLLTTLEHLQNPDGSIGFSWNCFGDGFYNRSYKRTGSIAWAGYAAVMYERLSGDNRFRKFTEKAAGYVLSQQVKDTEDPRFGFFKGGHGYWSADYSKFERRPAEFCCMEHQIDSYFFLRDYHVLTRNDEYRKAATLLKRRMMEVLWDDQAGHFHAAVDAKGPNRDLALDASSWGAIFLCAIGEKEKARRALAFVERTFKSSAEEISGYKAYAGQYRDHPMRDWNKVNMVWSEGSLGVAMAHLKVDDRQGCRKIVTEIARMQQANGGVCYSTCADQLALPPEAIKKVQGRRPTDPLDEFLRCPSAAGTVWLGLVEFARLNGPDLFWRPDPQTILRSREQASGARLLWRELRVFSGHTDAVRHIAFSPDGATLASGSDDGTVRVWRVSDGQPVHILKDAASQLAFRADGATLSTCTCLPQGHVWRVADGEQLKTVRLPMPRQLTHHFIPSITCVALSPDGTMVATASDCWAISVWRLADGKRVNGFGYDDGVAKTMGFSCDGKALAAGTTGGTLWLRQTRDGKPIRMQDKHGGCVNCVAFSTDGAMLASGSDDETIRLWRVSTRQTVLTLRGHTAGVNCVAFSPNGEILASGGGRTVRLWRVADGELLRILEGHTAGVNCVTFGSDGPTLASASDDKTIRLWGLPSSARTSPPAAAAEPASEQERAIAAIKELGGIVEQDESRPGKPVVAVDFRFSDVFKLNLVHLDKLAELQELRIATEVNDNALAHLEGLSKLETLELNSQRVTNTGMAHLRGLTELKTLHLDLPEVTDAGAAHLKGLTKLEELKISRAKITDAGLVHLKGLTKLKNLDLYGDNITNAGLAHLKGLTNLETLQLSSRRVSDKGLVHLKALTELKSLILFRTRVTGAELVHLKGLNELNRLYLGLAPVTDADLIHVKGLPKLNELELHATDVTDAGLIHLKGLVKLRALAVTGRQQRAKITGAGLANLKGLTKLEKLSLHTSDVTDEGLIHLQGLTGMTSLVLWNTNVTDAGLVHLKALANLEELSLSQTKITDAGLEHLKGLAKLRTLTLGWSRLTDAAPACLKGLARLETLGLDNTEITDAGLAHLKEFTELRSLNLNYNTVTDSGLPHVKGLAKLEELHLCRTKVTDAGLAHLKALGKLESLELVDTNVSDAGLGHLAELSSLRTLDLRSTHVTNEGVKKLEKALPKCNIEH